jgi:hypothetical protein
VWTGFSKYFANASTTIDAGLRALRTASELSSSFNEAGISIANRGT